ncbi:MAG: N-acetylmuramic acid 6-phosphate etherase [Cyclobacteriaceae bacterium]
MSRIPDTEKDSNYQQIDQMSTHDILANINEEDLTVAHSVRKAIPQVEKFVDAAYERMSKGGRLFYIGSGTSGRLGIVDASECPPTYGVPHDMVIGIIAGGDGAIRKAVEFAEDDDLQAWLDINEYQPNTNDVLVGIAASGTTPYVIGGVTKAREFGMLTGCVTCSHDSPLAVVTEFPIEAPVGPEFITGSTRMKAGTAQKMILNMITTSLMIKLGKVKGNKMVDMQLSNKKLVARGVRMIMEQSNLEESRAQELLLKYGSVREVLKKL